LLLHNQFHEFSSPSERQALVGPPESMREHVVAASKAMRNGDWRKCRDFIINSKMNAKVWDLFYEADKVREMLSRKIQEETLRTYLFTYSKVYNSISIDSLGDMFELDKISVHAIVAKMIISEELMASMDEPTECMVMHRTEPSRLQSLSLQLSDKLAQLVENNERLLELRPGGWQGQWRGKDGDRRDGENFGGNKFGDNREGGNRRDRDGNRDGGDRQFGNRDGGNRRGGGGGGDRDHHHRDQNGPGKFGDRINFGGNRGGYSNNKFGDKKNFDRKPRTFGSNNRE